MKFHILDIAGVISCGMPEINSFPLTQNNDGIRDLVSHIVHMDKNSHAFRFDFLNKVPGPSGVARKIIKDLPEFPEIKRVVLTIKRDHEMNFGRPISDILLEMMKWYPPNQVDIEVPQINSLESWQSYANKYLRRI